jgi:hypothetical protein
MVIINNLWWDKFDRNLDFNCFYKSHETSIFCLKNIRFLKESVKGRENDHHCFKLYKYFTFIKMLWCKITKKIVKMYFE